MMRQFETTEQIDLPRVTNEILLFRDALVTTTIPFYFAAEPISRGSGTYRFVIRQQALKPTEWNRAYGHVYGGTPLEVLMAARQEKSVSRIGLSPTAYRIIDAVSRELFVSEYLSHTSLEKGLWTVGSRKDYIAARTLYADAWMALYRLVYAA